MIKYQLLFSFLIYSTFVSANIYIKIDNSTPIIQSSVYINKNQTITLNSDLSGHWAKLKPILCEYDNLKNSSIEIEPITYEKIYFENCSNELFIDNLELGTHYFGKLSKSNKSISTIDPIHLINDNIVQVVVRENDTYIGFITEQLNLPFIIPPKLLPNYGHQTDLNIGTDCAELAIYGMRRLGYNIPYVGPKGIKKFLKETSSIEKGTILHFGFQVSILYKDLGKIGQLDSKDLIIHAFENKVKIEKFGNTKLFNKKHKQYQWYFEGIKN